RFFFSSRRRHTRSKRDWSSDVCSSDLAPELMRKPRLAIALLAGGVVAWVLAALSIGPLLAWVVTGPDVLPGDAAAVCSQCLAARSEERRVGEEGGGRG